MQLYERTYEPIILIGLDMNTLNINEKGIYNRIQANDETYINKQYLDIVETNNLEIDGIKFQFTDMIWDFSDKKQEGKTHSNYIHKFDTISNLSDYYITICKLYVFSKILENGIHWTSTKANCKAIFPFLNYMNRNYCYNLEDLELTKVQDYFENMNIGYRTLVRYKSMICDFITYYSIITGEYIDNSIIDYLTEVNKGELKAQCQQNKTKLLPQEFMKKFKDLLYEEVISTNSKIEDKTKAGLLFICTQTGLRATELLMLDKNCIETKVIDGQEINYLNYKSTKNVHGGGYTTAQTIANEKVINTIEILKGYLDVEQSSLSNNTDYNHLNKYLRDFISINAHKLNAISDVVNQSFEGKPIKIKENNEVKYINMPTIKQFRVYFATELTQRGYSEMLIAKLLNHKDEKMFNYYSRPTTSIQEDPYFSEMVVKETILNHYEILGTNGKAYSKQINSFIKNRNISVKEDLDAIIRDVLKEMPIRRKLGGYCIKPNPLRACEHDSPTNELYCAYGLCQNQCHSFYHCIYYYNEMKYGQQLVITNKKNGYKQEAQKELYKVQGIINTKLIPELEELQKELQIKGKGTLINQFKDLEPIINDLDNIIVEVEEWKLKKL